jgi:hypothetical protein
MRKYRVKRRLLGLLRDSVVQYFADISGLALCGLIIQICGFAICGLENL